MSILLLMTAKFCLNCKLAEDQLFLPHPVAKPMGLIRSCLSLGDHPKCVMKRDTSSDHKCEDCNSNPDERGHGGYGPCTGSLLEHSIQIVAATMHGTKLRNLLRSSVLMNLS